jgi:3-deoxy-D-manno-octulosonate 8-phosphate phosphatase (KDO 8-P phosphatase)
LLYLFNQITTFAFDVDGVLTDGTLILLPGGEMARTMNIKDGYALQLAVKKGYHVVIISGGLSNLVQERLKKLGVKDVYMAVKDKRQVLTQWMQTHGVKPDQVLYMGDDVPDIAPMELVGLPCCPADACVEVQAISRYISPLKGGAGCGRDVIEKVMRLHQKWQITEDVSSL